MAAGGERPMTRTGRRLRIRPPRVPRVLSDHDIGSTMLLRGAGLLLGFTTSLLAASTLTRQFGASGYAVYAVIISILAAFPFLDLGLGAGVINATSDARAGRCSPESYRKALQATFTLLSCVSVLTLALVLLLTWSNQWSLLLGPLADVPTAPEAATFSGIMFALSLPWSIGSRILQGRGEMVAVTKISLVGGVIQVTWIGVASVIGLKAPLYALGASLALLVVGLVTTLQAGASVRLRLRHIIRPTSVRAMPSDYSFGRSSVPYLVSSVGIALGLQSDRFILAHVSDARAVAEYSFTAQFSVAVTSVITLSSLNLWPTYRDALRDARMRAEVFTGHLRTYALLGVAGAIAHFAMSLLLSHLILPADVRVSVPVAAASALFVFTWALVRPSTMLLNDSRGLWTQAGWVVAMGTGNFILTWVLAGQFGAVGAFAASVVSVAVLQVLPLTVCAMRRISVNELSAATVSQV